MVDDCFDGSSVYISLGTLNLKKLRSGIGGAAAKLKFQDGRLQHLEASMA